MSKKVIYLLHLPPPIHGSSVVGKQIMDSQVIHEGYDASFINLSTSSTVDAIGRVSLIKLYTYLKILARLLFQLLFERPRWAYVAITVQGGAFYKDAIVVLLLRLFRVSVIFHMHNKGVLDKQDKRPYKWLYPIVFKGSRAILLSERLYPDVARYFARNRVDICPNGIQKSCIEMEREGDLRATPSILFLSNLIRSKGIMILLDACSILKKRGVQFECQVAGGEGDVTVSDLESQCKELGIEARVKYIGRVSGQAKVRAFQEASIFCLPTFYHYECLPLVLIEAMQWSLPLVSTPEGGISDLVLEGQTGFVVEQQDAAALADRLQILLCDADLRTRMGAAARKHYENHFTELHFENRMREILSEL